MTGKLLKINSTSRKEIYHELLTQLHKHTIARGLEIKIISYYYNGNMFHDTSWNVQNLFKFNE